MPNTSTFSPGALSVRRILKNNQNPPPHPQPQNGLFFTLGLFSPKLSASAGPLTLPVLEHSHSSEAVPSGSRRIKEKKPGEKPQIPRAQEPRAAPGNEEQNCSEPTTGSICAPVCLREYYLLIKRRKNN